MARTRLLRACLIATVAVTLGACAGQPASQQPSIRNPVQARAVTPTGSSVAGIARTLIGTPYRYGGADPSGFDCSGLVFYSYTRSGFGVPRTSLDQFKAARKISLAEAAAGDLVFFQDQAKLAHVGIYLGDGTFVHAPTEGRTVSIARLDSPYYQEHLVAVGRLLPH